MKGLATILTVVMLLILLVSGCSISRQEGISDTVNENQTTSKLTLNGTEIQTILKYIENDSLKQGDSSSIISKLGDFGLVGDPNYLPLGIYNKRVILLEAESNDIISNTIDSLSTTNLGIGSEMILSNILGERGNKVNYITLYGKYLVWSECKYANIVPDETHGAEWKMYLANLDTGEMRLIDEDDYIYPDFERTLFNYLCPSFVSINDKYLAYLGYAEHAGQVTSVVKLYDIDNEQIEIIDYLDQDLSLYSHGFPSIYGKKVAICSALSNADGTYAGSTSIYDINNKTLTRLNTPENVINAHLAGKYLVAEGKPNKTFYDSEICIYDMEQNTWVYKINHDFSQYKNHPEAPLQNISISNNFVTWDVNMLRCLLVFDLDEETLYTIDSKERYMDYCILLYGNLLIWIDESTVDGEVQRGRHYAILK